MNQYQPDNRYLSQASDPANSLQAVDLAKPIHQFFQLELKKAFESFLRMADDALYDMAQKTQKDEEATSFFDALNQIRSDKTTMLMQFGRLFDRLNFTVKIGTDQSKLRFVGSDSPKVSLSLVEDNDMERELAKSAFLSRLHDCCASTNKQLDMRFKRLGELLSIELESNPYGPMELGRCFTDPISELSLKDNAEVVLYKLLEREATKVVPTLYGYLNQYLADNGILSELAVVQPESQQQPNIENKLNDKRFASVKSKPIQAYGETIAKLSSLLDQRKGQSSGDEQAVIEQDELLSILDHFQHNIDINRQGTQALDFRALIQSGVPELAEVNRASIGHSNDDLLDIVSLMFDFILEDNTVCPAIKADIARLQIPFLKIAMVDASFFKNKQHPARQLLNKMAHAGIAIGLKPCPADRAMIEQIKQVVDKIVEDFTLEVELFNQLLEQFAAFVQQESKRSEMILNRTKEAEKGKALYQHANSVCERAINKILQGQLLPQSVLQAIQQGFKPCMAYHYLNSGAKSPQLQELVKNIQRLVASVQPPYRAKLQFSPKQLERLNKLLGDTLAHFHRDSAQIGKWLKDIERQQVLAKSDSCDDVTEFASQSTQEAPLKQAVSVESKCIAEQMAIGSWVEIKLQQDWQRGKLVARLKTSSKMLFVNRTGIKVAEFLEAEFAQALDQGNVRVIENGAIFEKALESVICNLKSMRNQHAHA